MENSKFRTHNITSGSKLWKKVYALPTCLETNRNTSAKETLVQGWVRTKRDSKAGISFIELNDGSCLKSLQVIAELDPPGLQ